MNSRILFVDGISGAGKGTQIPFIQSYLESKGYDVLSVREPSSFLDGISREYKRRGDRSGRVATLLFAADRLHQYEHTLVPFLRDNPKGIVVSDRSKLSSMVYQAEQGVAVEDIVAMNRFYPDADLSLLLLCEPEIAIGRIDRRGEGRSVDEEIGKIRSLKEGYEALAGNFEQKIVRTDGDPEAIQAQLRSHLNTFLGVPQQKVVFLDKDGTLVDNSGYPQTIPTDAIYYEHTVNGLRALHDAGYMLFMISSQPWVARGRMTGEEVEKIFQSVTEKYASHGITIKGYGYCPHARSEGCRCKKPNTLLLEQIAAEHPVDIEHSFFIGDMNDDVLCGRNFGLRSIRVETGKADPKERNLSADYICADVNAAAEWILRS